MKRTFLTMIAAAAAALMLSACAGAGQTVQSAASVAVTAADAVHAPAPATLADRTVVDEQGVLAVELAYKAARLAMETGVDAGLIKGATALRLAELDNRAYAAVGVARQAYAAGNAGSYSSALTSARAAVSDLIAITGKAN